MTGGEGTRRLHQCLSTLQNYSCQKSRAGIPNSSTKAVYKISHDSASTTAVRLPAHVSEPNTKAAGECGVNDISQRRSGEAHPFVSRSWDQRNSMRLHYSCTHIKSRQKKWLYELKVNLPHTKRTENSDWDPPGEDKWPQPEQFAGPSR